MVMKRSKKSKRRSKTTGVVGDSFTTIIKKGRKKGRKRLPGFGDRTFPDIIRSGR